MTNRSWLAVAVATTMGFTTVASSFAQEKGTNAVDDARDRQPQAPSPTVSREHCKLAAKYHTATHGLSMLVMHQGRIIFEQYDHGHDAEQAYRLASGTKSFWGVVAVCAQEDGLLSLDEKAADTLTEWRDDPRKSMITVRHLLSFTSGLSPDNDALRGPLVDNKYQHALHVASEYEPGAEFAYGASHLFAFGELLQRKLRNAGRQETPLDYLQRRILKPIGMQVDRWSKDATDHPQLPFGAFLTARQWAKFGQLILQKGQWGGHQIVPAGGLAECFRGSDANPYYGLNWWLIGDRSRQQADSAANPIPHDAVAAKGAGTQRLYVLPSLELVVVRQAETSAFSEGEFLARLLQGKATLSDELAANGPPRSPNLRWFSRLDSNNDDQLSADEVPDRLRQRLNEADSNQDGLVTRQEVLRALAP